MLTRLFVLVSRLRAAFGGTRLDDDFDREVASHIAMATDDNISRGMTPDQARRAAIVRFGGRAQIVEQRREDRSLLFVSTLCQDVRYAVRSFRRSPGFTLLAIATLGIGVGVNATVFTLFDAVALRGLPVREPNSLVRLARSFQGGARGDAVYAFSLDESQAFRLGARTLSAVVAASWPLRVTYEAGTMNGQVVSGNYFSELGVRAAAGRLLIPDDERTARAVIVLSASAWRQWFAADPRIAGRSVRLNDTTFTIAGVAADEFIGTGNPPQVPDFWAPLTLQPQLAPQSDWIRAPQIRPLQLLGRVASHETAASVGAELTVLVHALDTESGLMHTIAITPEPATFFGGTNDLRFRAFATLVMTVVGMVLLIACANLSNMMFARAASRRHELAVRLAIGASRGRVARQLLTESLLLAAGGGAAGFLLSVWGCRWVWTRIMEAVRGFMNTQSAFAIVLEPDTRIFVYTIAVSAAAGVAFGVWPAARFSKADVGGGLKDDAMRVGGAIARSRMRGLLVAAQVAASLALLVSAGLLARGVARSESNDPGFAESRVFAVYFNHGTDPAAALRLQQRVFERVQSAPAVASAAYVQRVPLAATWSLPVADADAPEHVEYTLANFVSPGYFETMGLSIERGRAFVEPEPEGGAIISAAGARLMWPNADPIGRRVRLSTSQARVPDLHDFVIVGVARDANTANISRRDPMYIYLPRRATDRGEILFRAAGDTTLALASVRAAVGGVDRTLLPALQVISLDTYARSQTVLTKTLSEVAAVLAAIALLLASIGIYGVMNVLVAQRVREIGVRMALGATAGGVVRTMLADGLRPVIAGIAGGLLLTFAILAVLRASVLLAPAAPDLLFGVDAFDPLNFLELSGLLVASALTASAVPAFRAARVDPMTALRVE
ncbi:MAG TPA: ADOP family duplicated permease [Vicinamibacterales bacterium]|nr:ADOP family duplicated permease [Vicinamibacterales bacterium]